MLQKKYDIETDDILAAAKMKNEELLELLIKLDAIAGEYALKRVIRDDNIEYTKLLLKHGAKISEDALESANYRNNKEIAKLLIENGT